MGQRNIGSIGLKTTLGRSVDRGRISIKLPEEHQTVFHIRSDSKIPGIEDIRTPDARLERMQSLSKVPKHKPAAPKYDFDPKNRSILAFTQEDTEQFGNLPLINTLREPKSFDYVPKTTVANPPKFYDDDQAKWVKKFEETIKDRQRFKRTAMKIINFSAMNSNPNVKKTFDPDQTLAGTSYTGGQLLPKTSEFKQVLKRRKSRQSTRMPTQVDFEYVGNTTAQMHHLIGKGNKDQLNFELNLRRYKNSTSFEGEQPFLYPAPKGFKPEITLQQHVDFVAGTTRDFSKKSFKDKFEEKNVNSILHLLDSAAKKGTVGVYEQHAWQGDLRGDRKERNKAKK